MLRAAILWSLALTAACTRSGPATAPPAPPPPTQPPPTISVSPTVDPNNPLVGLDADIDAIMAAQNVPGLAIAVVYRDEVVLARGYGVRDRGHKDPVDADTVFAIASNTKAFVATAIAVLVDEGKLGWDDRVIDHLPDLVLWDDYATKHMRIRDLLCHRSGLATWAGDVAWIGAKLDTAALLDKLKHVPASYDLRERYGYTNLMFVVAGEVVRAKTGQSWDAFVQARLLDPLGMARTSTTTVGLADQPNVATAHAATDDGEAKVPYLNVDAAGAAAALNSSVNDMAKWLRLQLDNGQFSGRRIIPEAAVTPLRVAHTPVRRGPAKAPPQALNLSAYGLGWMLGIDRGRLVVTHGGGLPGMVSRVMLLPEEGLGIVVLTNSETGAAAGVAKLVAARYLGADIQPLLDAATKARKAPPKVDKAEPTPLPVAAKAYTGRFTNDLLGAAAVQSEDSGLRMTLPDHGGLACTLVHTTDDTFDCAWDDPIFGVSTVVFERKGNAASTLRFKVRPAFIDPLEYRFSRKPTRSPR